MVGRFVGIRKTATYDDIIPNSDPVERVLPMLKRPMFHERQITI